MITYANLYWKNVAHVIEFGITGADKGLACGPLHHVGALDLTTTTALYAGGTVEIHRKFDAADVLDTIEQRGITNVWLAPSMVNSLLAHPTLFGRDLSGLRLVIDGGEKMPLPLIERLLRAFPGAWFADAFGMTETVSGDTFLDPEHTVSKLGSVGRPCQYLELEIWDEHGAPVSAGEKGEIVLRGPKVFAGYWRDPDATAAAFTADGFVRTGDLGWVDEDGYLRVTGRKKDLIIRGGHNIYPAKIENLAMQHQAVERAAVVPVPDERLGEKVCLAVMPRQGSSIRPDELLAHLDASGLSHYDMPEYFLELKEIPLTASGKILKRDLVTLIQEGSLKPAPIRWQARQ
jgi:acyl-CoA synthetase (AMP-forming)/AMP-acid ligase II